MRRGGEVWGSDLTGYHEEKRFLSKEDGPLVS